MALTESGTPRKILIVEDEESVRQALTKIFENYGHKVFAARDGQEGLKVYGQQGDFDIVFTDLSLPGISGWEVAESIKGRDPRMPVVILSGWDIPEGEKRAEKVERVLNKPVKIKDMLKAVKDFCG